MRVSRNNFPALSWKGLPSLSAFLLGAPFIISIFRTPFPENFIIGVVMPCRLGHISQLFTLVEKGFSSTISPKSKKDDSIITPEILPEY